jgi:hypothetical protein
MSRNRKQKLELTWIGKGNRPKLEPRILLEDAEKSYHAQQRVMEHDIFDNRLIFATTYSRSKRWSRSSQERSSAFLSTRPTIRVLHLNNMTTVWSILSGSLLCVVDWRFSNAFFVKMALYGSLSMITSAII